MMAAAGRSKLKTNVSLYWRPYLLHKSKMRRIPTELDIWTVSSSLETSLGDLEWRAFVPQGLLQGLDVLLLVVDLLHGLAQVGLELVVSVVGLRDPLLERHVRVVPVAPHLVRALRGGKYHFCQDDYSNQDEYSDQDD